MQISRPLLATAAFIVLSTGHVAYSADPALRELHDRAKPEWVAVRAATDDAATHRVVRRMVGDPAFVAKYYAPLSVGDVVYDFAYGPEFVLSESKPQSPRASVQGANANYEFQLVQGKGRSGWVVASVRRIANEKHFADVAIRLKEDMKDGLIRHYGIPLDEFLSHKSVKPIKVADDDGLVRIDYAIENLAAGKSPFPRGSGEVQKGTLWLDPQHHYGLKRELVHVKVPDGVFTHEIRNELAKTAQGMSYVKVMERFKSDVFQIIVTNEVMPAGRPASDATLSHYGLPEPEWLLARQAERRNRWLVYAAVAVILVASAAGLRAYLRRRGNS